MRSVTCWTKADPIGSGGTLLTLGSGSGSKKRPLYSAPPLTPQIWLVSGIDPSGGPLSRPTCPRNTIASSKRAKTFAARRNIWSALVKLGSATWAPRSHTFTYKVLRGFVVLSSTDIRRGSDGLVPGLSEYPKVSALTKSVSGGNGP